MFVMNIENLKKKWNIIYSQKKTLSLSIVYSKCGNKYENIFKEEKSIEILKIPCLINNAEEYQKIYNHVWGKHKSRTSN